MNSTETISAISAPWSPQRRASQSKRMSNNLNRHWDSVLGDPERKNQMMRERSEGFKAGHPLSVWRCNIKVNMTDSELGKAIGVSDITVSNWQNGKTKPQEAHRRRLNDLAARKGVPLDMSWANR